MKTVIKILRQKLENPRSALRSLDSLIIIKMRKGQKIAILSCKNELLESDNNLAMTWCP